MAALTRTTVTGTVYNLEQPPGLPLSSASDVEVTPLINEHIFLEGHDSWSTDYHEYFEINNVSKRCRSRAQVQAYIQWTRRERKFLDTTECLLDHRHLTPRSRIVDW